MRNSEKMSGGLTKLSQGIKQLANKKIRILLLMLSGLLTGMTLVFPQIGFIEWLAIIPAGAVLLTRGSDKAIKLRSVYLDGLAFFYVYYIACYHWFVNLYPMEFIDGMTPIAALVVVISAVFGLSLLQALMGGFVFVVGAIIFRSKLFEKIKAELLKPFAAAGLWAIFEWLQNFGWWGVPWGKLAIGQTYYLVGVQNASWLGSYFITFVIAAVNLVLAYALLNPPKVKIGVLTAVCLLAFQYGSGTLIWFTNNTSQGQKITVACIQGNVSSNDKWDSSSASKTLENYTKYTKQAAEQGAKLVIWPETAFPYDISNNEAYTDYFENLAYENDVHIIVGAFTSNESGELLNSLICFTPQGEQLETVYSKRRLVPFGEFVPLRPVFKALIPPLAELVMSGDDVAAGKGAQIMELDNGISLGGLVCFDSIYDGLTLESVRAGAELICLSTNDSWFTDSRALNMHNAQAQLRAIESGRYVARAANTGISTGITSRGEIITSLEPLVDGMIVFDAYATQRVTLWSIIGNIFVYVLIGIYVMIIVAETAVFINRMVKKKRNSSKGLTM